MNIKIRTSAWVLALASAFTLSAAAPALAQNASRSVASMAITSFDVQPLQRLRPGDVLDFQLQATPGAIVMVTIDGGAAPVELVEVRPGAYEGSYTIRQSDRLSEQSRVTARVLKDGRAVSASLARSLVAGAPAVGRAPTGAITDFQLAAPGRIRPGEELRFSLRGAPGGQARVDIDGAQAVVPLREVRRGVYEGRYVVRRQDRLRGELQAQATLVNDGRASTQRLERVVVADDRRAPQASACVGCGTVESVRIVEVKDGSSNALGTIAGGILGGVIGNQVGGGSGRDAARVIGAIGGAYAGNRVQNNRNKNQVWRVTVRLQAGGTRDFDYAEDPEVKVGTRVKLDGDVLVRQ
jgi:outer membrane lipoprotein SlyB